MDDDVIEAIADAFAARLAVCYGTHAMVVLDDAYAVAVVIHDFEPTYDLRYYYKRIGFPEPYPIHEM
jgi:hypothetical protein